MFNPITYSKAASILKMMYHVIGEVPWREFLVSFVAKNKFGNVDTNDFFDALENIISHDTVLKDHNFKDIFLAWFVQKKIPTVYIRHDFKFSEPIRVRSSLGHSERDLESSNYAKPTLEIFNALYPILSYHKINILLG